MDIVLQRVTHQEEVERLVQINHDAMKQDPLFNWMALYTEYSEDEGTRLALTSALDDPSYEIVKAVAKDPLAPETEKVVGFLHFFRGFIELPKGTHSKGDFQKAQSDDTTTKAIDEAYAARIKVGDAIYVQTRNFYINTIRGQRHLFVRRLMVDPKFQRKGTAAKLLQYLSVEADEMRTPVWLFSRPAGVCLYEKSGFIQVGETQLDVPEFKVPASKAMVRWPNSHAEDW